MSNQENIINLSSGICERSFNSTVCIVGSGPAGVILAVDLANAGVDVILLESGDGDPDHRIDHMIDSVEVCGEMDLRFGLSRQLGGATNLWSGRAAPFEAIDFEKRDWVPHSGWPLSLNDLKPYYEKAGEILNIPGYSSFAEYRNASSLFGDSDLINIKYFQWAPEPFKAGQYVKKTVRTKDNLRVLLNAPVAHLCESKDDLCIKTAVVIAPDGRSINISARYFVLATGGIETPRILLNSRSVRPDGIGNDNDVVGRYFSTHPKANMAALILDRSISTTNALFTDNQLGDGYLRFGVGFSSKAQKKFNLLNHYVQLSPLLEYQASSLFDIIKGSNALNSPLIERSKLVRGILPGLGLFIFELIGRFGGFQRKARKFILRGFLDQYPNSNNRITLSSQRDKRGMRKANICWKFSEQDRASVVAFFACLDEYVRGQGIGRVEYQKIMKMEEWPLVGIHSHFMGTTRMGDDPKYSVTSKDCQVHGSPNLFVAGPSLFPTYSYANPVYTIAALSLRLAQHLKSELDT